MKTLIVIPARYASTRLPGKPLVLIAGQSMLQRVVNIARQAIQDLPDTQIVVATEDARIAAHCDKIDVACAMTPADCPTGTDRAWEVVRQMPQPPEFILNLQGDAPLTPPDFVMAMIASYRDKPVDVVTPVAQLGWQQLDKLRENKKTTPFSGTTAVFDEKDGRAFWFSKNIIPAMRGEEKLRQAESMSPVYRHVGLYGYARQALQKFVSLPESRFEQLEGLEQMRALENGLEIRCVVVDYKGRPAMSGVDSPEDIARAEALIT